MTFKVYIVNLTTYYDDYPKGAWFNLPVKPEKIKEKIGCGKDDFEYAIHDYVLPFDVDDFVRIEQLNSWVEAIADLPYPFNEDEESAMRS